MSPQTGYNHSLSRSIPISIHRFSTERIETIKMHSSQTTIGFIVVVVHNIFFTPAKNLFEAMTQLPKRTRPRIGKKKKSKTKLNKNVFAIEISKRVSYTKLQTHVTWSVKFVWDYWRDVEARETEGEKKTNWAMKWSERTQTGKTYVMILGMDN